MTRAHKLVKKGKIRSTVDYLLPLMDKYDPLREAEKLMEDKDLRKIDLEKKDVISYLIQGQYRYKALMNSAKIADTADRLTSGIGAAFEIVGLMAGGAPGFGANGIEEAVEMLFKAPFFYFCKQENPTKIPGLLAREAATFGVPVGGDAYDIITNKYVSIAYETIREDAKLQMLQDYAAKQRIKPHLSLLRNRH